jgi:hypothetical protein
MAARIESLQCRSQEQCRDDSGSSQHDLIVGSCLLNGSLPIAPLIAFGTTNALRPESTFSRSPLVCRADLEGQRRGELCRWARARRTSAIRSRSSEAASPLPAISSFIPSAAVPRSLRSATRYSSRGAGGGVRNRTIMTFSKSTTFLVSSLGSRIASVFCPSITLMSTEATRSASSAGSICCAA